LSKTVRSIRIPLIQKSELFRKIAFQFISASLCVWFTGAAQATPNYHLVGWLNTPFPGAGQWLLGNNQKAVSEFAIEGTTFGTGFAISRLSPMTIDGVPQDLPIRTGQTFYKTQSGLVCTVPGPHGTCLHWKTTQTKVAGSADDSREYDTTLPIMASMLQEFGIKYHMVNVFESYRTAATVDGEVKDPWIDPRPTNELFSDPFKIENLASAWVYVPLGLITAMAVYDYTEQTKGGLDPIRKMNPWSNTLFATNFVVVQPIGSGAPEEMFYRGFLQNEFYHIVSSPFFSVPMSAALFSFSHAPSGRIGAAVSGLYLGTLAQIDGGRLNHTIALHFWSVVVLGIETAFLTIGAQGDAPAAMQFQFQF